MVCPHLSSTLVEKMVDSGKTGYRPATIAMFYTSITPSSVVLEAYSVMDEKQITNAMGVPYQYLVRGLTIHRVRLNTIRKR